MPIMSILIHVYMGQIEYPQFGKNISTVCGGKSYITWTVVTVTNRFIVGIPIHQNIFTSLWCLWCLIYSSKVYDVYAAFQYDVLC